MEFLLLFSVFEHQLGSRAQTQQQQQQAVLREKNARDKLKSIKHDRGAEAEASEREKESERNSPPGIQIDFNGI